jgi:RND family efflux transporter MFP subunit
MTDASSPARPPRDVRPGPVKGLLFLGLMAGIVAVGALLALSQRGEAGTTVAVNAPAPMPVTVESFVFAEELLLEESFTGLAQARRSAELGFERGGRLASLSVDVGTRVRAGQPLARLDTRAIAAQIESARAGLAEAQAARALAEASAQRVRELAARDLAPRQRLDEAEAAVAQASARIDAAQAGVDLLQVQLALSTITAPFDGVITARLQDEGAIAAPGVPLLRLVEDGVVDVTLGLPGDLAATLQAGEVLNVTGPTGLVEMRVRGLTGVVDASRRTTEIVLERTGGAPLRPGEVVRLSRSRPVSERGGWVPISALAEASRGLWSLYVLEAEGDGLVVRPRGVEIVHTDGQRAYVRGPVAAGDRYVTQGLQRLVPGMRVSPTAARVEG